MPRDLRQRLLEAAPDIANVDDESLIAWVQEHASREAALMGRIRSVEELLGRLGAPAGGLPDRLRWLEEQRKPAPAPRPVPSRPVVPAPVAPSPAPSPDPAKPQP